MPKVMEPTGESDFEKMLADFTSNGSSLELQMDDPMILHLGLIDFYKVLYIEERQKGSHAGSIIYWIMFWQGYFEPQAFHFVEVAEFDLHKKTFKNAEGWVFSILPILEDRQRDWEQWLQFKADNEEMIRQVYQNAIEDHLYRVELDIERINSESQ